MTQKVANEHRNPPVQTSGGTEQNKMEKPEWKEG